MTSAPGRARRTIRKDMESAELSYRGGSEASEGEGCSADGGGQEGGGSSVGAAGAVSVRGRDLGQEQALLEGENQLRWEATPPGFLRPRAEGGASLRHGGTAAAGRGRARWTSRS
jgi:hypothetical protein